MKIKPRKNKSKKKIFKRKKSKALIPVTKKDPGEFNSISVTSPEHPKSTAITSYKALPSEIVQKVLNLIQIDFSVREACDRVGVAYDYFSNMVGQNIDGLGQRVRTAKLTPKLIHLQRIHQGARNWKASAWFLERAYREQYGREITISSEDKEGKKKQILKIGDQVIEF